MRMSRSLYRSMTGFPSGFWVLWSATLVNRMATFVYPLLGIYLTTELGYSATTAGLVLATFGIGSVAGSLIGGELTDRIGRRPTMAGAQLLAAVSTAIMGFTPNGATIAVLVFFMGLGVSASRPAVQAMIVDMVPQKDRVRAFSVNYWAVNIGFGFSAVVAGYLVHEGYLWIFLGDAATTLICAVVMWVRLPETRPERADTASSGTEAPISSRQVFRDSRFMTFCLLALGVWLMMYQGWSILPVDMAGRGISTQAYGLIIALNGVVIILLQIPVTALVKGRKLGLAPVLTLSAVLLGAGFGLTGLAGTSLIFSALCVVIWTLGEILYAPASSAAVGELAHTQTRGRYQGVYSLSGSVASVLAPLLGGLVLDHRGGYALWSLCAAVGVVAAAGFWILFLRAARSADGSGGDVGGRSAGPQGPVSNPALRLPARAVPAQSITAGIR
ncbi:MFS transporter [Micromonospora sp. WMMD961]|uniref:MDR family MFS transporter n=1 Tax=Micromonospora sp. WMMD961 TaxID=3016100 RepID=UPI00241733B4|nr:MFS transporter [Micromonospora sp. WMMD961]MDG4780661.1 MFS transporter [Micromonospora sp. WMMD961]